MTDLRPAEVFPPGEFLREELDARGWTQGDLAAILGRSVNGVNQIIMGKVGITPDTAQGLAAALGTSAQYWMQLDTAYQLWRTRKDDADLIARRALLYSIAPVKDIVSRGWVEPSDNLEVLEARVLKFLGMTSLHDPGGFFAHAARRSTPYDEPPSPLQRAWLCRARQLAHAVHADTFTRDNLNKALGRLAMLLQAPEELRHVPRIMSEAGIRFVIVEPLPGSKIDGACFWLDERSPVVALSLRFERIDHFWFVLMHELGHVSRGDKVAPDTDMEVAVSNPERPEAERLADKFAGDHLVPSQDLANFIARARPLYSTRHIEAFAKIVKVHPGIVVGQLQHHGEVRWDSFRKLLVPIRDRITATALTDGWGAVVATPL
jgi:HTH-type transcriptional regulator/antitoxin HigA